MNVQQRIAEKCDGLKKLLQDKNRAYGNSVLDPVRVFSKASTIEQIKVRMDDKLSRIMRGQGTEAVPEDTIMDLAGYLIILSIAAEQDKL